MRAKDIEAPGCQLSKVKAPVPTYSLPSLSPSKDSSSTIGTMSSRSKMLLSGCFEVSVISFGLLVSKSVMAAAVRCSCTAQAGSAKVFLMLNSTSFEVNSRPLWKVTSSRSCSVSDRPSSDCSHDVASDGCGSRLSGP